MVPAMKSFLRLSRIVICINSHGTSDEEQNQLGQSSRGSAIELLRRHARNKHVVAVRLSAEPHITDGMAYFGTTLPH